MINLVIDNVKSIEPEEWFRVYNSFSHQSGAKLCGPYYDFGKKGKGVDIESYQGSDALMVILNGSTKYYHVIVTIDILENVVDTSYNDGGPINKLVHDENYYEDCPAFVYYFNNSKNFVLSNKEEKDSDGKYVFRLLDEKYMFTCGYSIGDNNQKHVYMHFYDDGNNYVLIPDIMLNMGQYLYVDYDVGNSWHNIDVVGKKKCPDITQSFNGNYISNDSFSTDEFTNGTSKGNLVSSNENSDSSLNICYAYDRYMSIIESDYISIKNCDFKKNETCNVKFIYDADQNISQVQDICSRIYRTQDVIYDGKENICVKSCLNFNEDLKSLKDKYNIKYTEGACSLSSRVIKFIANILKWIKYIAPVLVILLGILDFIKAISAQNDDEMKKVQGKFVKRLIAAALLFLLPFIIQFILERFNMANDNPYCNLL